jgi:hypothetical protein
VRSAPVHVVVGNPTHVALVTADPWPLSFPGDQALYDHLAGRGFDVIALRGSDIPDDGSSVDGTDLIVQSSSLASSTTVRADGGSKFKDKAIPVVVDEASNIDDLGFASVNGTTVTGSQIQIVDASSPLAAGLPAGNVTVATSDQTISVGSAADGDPVGAHIVATVPGTATQPVIFYYDKGEKGFDNFVMPARRVFFFFQDNTAAAANDNAWKLFDAAVNYALGTTNNPTGGTPPSASISVSGNSLTINSSGGGTIQAADALSSATVWKDIGAAPQTIQMTAKQGFFRIKK